MNLIATIIILILIGTYVDGNRHGVKGIYTWKTYGGDYDGGWKDSKHHGHGKYVWPDGDSYEGEFDDDKICGRGVFTSIVLGEEFDGTFVKCLDDGSDADPLLGSLRSGDGYCVYNNPHECEGYSYRGNWKNSYWDGENGILTREIPGGLGEKKFTMIDEYKGTFINGKITGRGVALYRAGENHPWKRYAGTWSNNQWDGEGTLTFQNNNEFIGNFVQSQMLNGRFYYANGDIYSGFFVDGLRQDDNAQYYFAKHPSLVRLDSVKFVQDNAVFVNKAYYKNEDTYVGPWDQDENVPHGPNGTKVYKEEDKLYVGDFVYGNRHGLGKCDYFFTNPLAGQCYNGQWADDSWHGYGTLTFAAGDMYIGQFNTGKREGRGTFTYSSDENFNCPAPFVSFAQNGSSVFGEYTGDWVNDTRTGNGKCMFGSPDVYYDGKWNQDNIEGTGTFVCKDYKYSGAWTQNEFNGRGELTMFNTGDTYDGDFDHGIIHGTGTYTHKTPHTFNGAYDSEIAVKNSQYHVKYTGSFDNSVRHGQGIMFYGATNVYYNGDWDQGSRTGNGTFFCPDFEYTGQWVNDVKEGTGKLTSDNHDYEGDWKRDFIDGHGKLTLHKSGEYYIGEFSSDKPHGFGKVYYKEGDVKFDGKFFNGRRIFGIFKWCPNAHKEYNNEWYRCSYDGEWTDTTELDWGDKFPDGKGKMTWKNSLGHTRTYDGEWKNGKCHGKGKLIISRGAAYCDETYEGPFANGEFHGSDGHHSFPSKFDPKKADKYVGDYSDGKRHGRGSMYRAEDGSRHEGEFEYNIEKARGIWHLKNGDVFEGFYREFDSETGHRGLGAATMLTYFSKDTYVGEVKDTTKHGDGELTLKAKKGFTFRSYKGRFQDDKFDGEGFLTYRKYMDEQEYKGGFKGGKRHGDGIITYKNGDEYVGQISDDMRHGKGKLIFGRKDETSQRVGWVEGQWRKDLLDGDVVYSHRDGSVYNGPYVEQRKDGSNATFKFADGSEYVGEVKRGKIHGTGVLTFNNNDPEMKHVRYEGEFKEGKQHGRGKYVSKDGSTYEGQFVEGLMQGRGKMTYPNKTVYDGEWKDGYKHGQGEFKSPEGEVLENGRFHNGIYINDKCCPSPKEIVTMTKFKMWLKNWSSTDPKIIESKKQQKQKARLGNKTSLDKHNDAGSSAKTATDMTPRISTPMKAGREIDVV